MKVITAPETYTKQPGDVFIFLAGGITKCPNWQDATVHCIEHKLKDFVNVPSEEHIIIFNPRRPDFDVSDPDASVKQIEWEFKALENCDIFSMFFCESDSVQPICMYELGRNIARMQMRFPKDWEDRLVITVEKDYGRRKDVQVQCELAIGYDLVGEYADYNNAIESHAEHIIMAYERTGKNKMCRSLS